MNGNAQTSQQIEQTPQQTEKRDKGRTRWPWWGQLILAVIALGVICFLLTWVPTHAVSGNSEGDRLSLYSMMAVFVGIVGMTISGVFIFMTFRIDRGTRRIARREAERASLNVAVKVANKTTKRIVNEIAKEEIGKIKNSWIEEMTGKIKETKDEVEYNMRRMQGDLDIRQADLNEKKEASDRAMIHLELRKEEAKKVVEDLKDDKQNKLDELNGIGNDAAEALQKSRKEAEDRLAELESGAAAKIRSVGETVATELRSVSEDVKTWLKSRENEARQQVAEAEEKAVAEVRQAGDEARRRIESTIRDVEDDARNRVDERVKGAVEEMVGAARRKIDEADVEKLVEEKVRPFMERSPLARLFGPRPRAPRP